MCEAQLGQESADSLSTLLFASAGGCGELTNWKGGKRNATWHLDENNSFARIILITHFSFVGSCFDRSFCLPNSGSQSLDTLHLCSEEDYNNLDKIHLRISVEAEGKKKGRQEKKNQRFTQEEINVHFI